MLLRQTAGGAIAITQPHHAWLAGELARAWGAGFEVPAPHEDVFCALALHDIGWLDWERAPTIDSETGYPHQFDKVEATVHTRLCTSGVEAARRYGLLPALHVSRHGVAIYELTFDNDTARHEQAKAVREFVEQQLIFQTNFIAQLVRRPERASFVTPEHLEKTKRFIVAVDTLSLHLCWGVTDDVSIDNVPTTDGSTQIKLRRKSAHEISLQPWPFVGDVLSVLIEGRMLTPARDQAGLDNVLHMAPTVFRSVSLVP